MKLKVDVNKNPTKKGIKIQFIQPTELNDNERARITQELQTILNESLRKFGLNVNVDTDITFSNVIGFTILLPDIKVMIKKALGVKDGDSTKKEEAPKEEETPPQNQPLDSANNLKQSME